MFKTQTISCIIIANKTRTDDLWLTSHIERTSICTQLQFNIISITSCCVYVFLCLDVYAINATNHGNLLLHLTLTVVRLIIVFLKY